MNRCFVVLALALILASCKDKPDQAPANDRRSAEGQVLGGTISDDMLPLDTVTSQSPPLREAPTPGAADTATEEPATDSSDAAGAEPAPAPEPTAAPTPEDGA
jgi:hypothetical protein